MELLTPFERAITRKWSKVYVVLNGTMLSVYHVKEPGLLNMGSSSKEPPLNPDLPETSKRGRLIKKYTLQHGEAGVAADYNK
jgi:hypothetical protein